MFGFSSLTTSSSSPKASHINCLSCFLVILYWSMASCTSLKTKCLIIKKIPAIKHIFYTYKCERSDTALRAVIIPSTIIRISMSCESSARAITVTALSSCKKFSRPVGVLLIKVRMHRAHSKIIFESSSVLLW